MVNYCTSVWKCIAYISTAKSDDLPYCPLTLVVSLSLPSHSFLLVTYIKDEEVNIMSTKYEGVRVSKKQPAM